MYPRLVRVFCLPLLCLALPCLLVAQVTGTITGTVRDPSGAVVPEAKVTATHTQTNLTRTVMTDPIGLYAIPQLAVGRYEIRIEKEGFAPFVQTDILLQANSQVQVEATLEVVTAIEQVTVSSRPNLLQTTSTNLVQVVDTQRVADLPLNGRNVLELISLTGSVMNRSVPSSRTQSYNIGQGLYYSPLSVGGAKAGNSNFLLDNADNNEVQSGMPRPFPNVDAVEEFSVQTNSFDAQYGKSTGGVVNVVTKAGTNSFHGSAFEFLRNFKMNAANFFSGRDSLKRNQFGGALGGPILKDQSFFFVSYQGTRMATASPAVRRTAPSAAMKAGDFSEWLGVGGAGKGAIHDPLSNGGYFSNNQIPTSRFDPAAAKILKLIPTSDNPLYEVTFGVPSIRTNDDQGVVRVDHSLTDRQRLSLRYFVFHYDRPPYIMPTNLLYGHDGQWGPSQAISASHTYVISPRWLHNVTFSFAAMSPTRRQADEPDVRFSTFGVRAIGSPKANLIAVSLSGWSNISFNSCAYTSSRSMNYAQNASYATGRHNLRFGGEMRRYETWAKGFTNAGGTASFTGQFLSDKGKNNAGTTYAEFLLGVMGGFSQRASYRAGGVRHQYFDFFVQDDIRITSRLTANLGLRWDPRAGMQQYGHSEVAWVPGQQSTVFPNAPRGLIYYGDKGLETGVIPNAYANFAPRVGLAYNLAPKTVLRSAYGIFYDEFQSILFNSIMQQFPYTDSVDLVGPLSFSDPFSGGPVLDPAAWRPDPAAPYPSYSSFYAMHPTGMRPARVQNWSLFLEYQLSSSLLLRAGYVGSKATHLVDRYQKNAAIYAPGATAANRNARRPLNDPKIGSLRVYESGGNSNYNALQLTLRKRYAKGFSILANYTFGKSIDYCSSNTGCTSPDPWDHRANIGPSDFDLTHRLVISGVWQMPRLETAAAPIRWLLGNWQSNGIFTAQTGVPRTITSGVDNNFDGVGGDFADYLGGSWQLSKSRSKEDKINQWFNTSVFARNALGTIGTGRRGQLRGPGEWNIDYSLFKTFPLSERMRLQFRFETFNLLNHANLGNPTTSVNSTRFGVIRSASDPRIIQLALKLLF